MEENIKMNLNRNGPWIRTGLIWREGLRSRPLLWRCICIPLLSNACNMPCPSDPHFSDEEYKFCCKYYEYTKSSEKNYVNSEDRQHDHLINLL
jgi:hypothetical protein